MKELIERLEEQKVWGEKKKKDIEFPEWPILPIDGGGKASGPIRALFVGREKEKGFIEVKLDRSDFKKLLKELKGPFRQYKIKGEFGIDPQRVSSDLDFKITGMAYITVLKKGRMIIIENKRIPFEGTFEKYQTW